MPLPDIADLTGESMSWLDAPALPDDEALLDDFLKHRELVHAKGNNSLRSALIQRTQQVLDMSGLRGAVMVLAHAGHGNYLGLLSSFSEGGAVGHDLRPDHEALFMQVAAAGVTATLLGVTAAVPELWPPELEQQPFLDREVELTAEVAAAAVPIHNLDTSRRPVSQSKKNKENRPGQRRVLVLRPGAVLSAEDLCPDVNSIRDVAEAAEAYRDLALSLPLRLWDNGNPPLHAALAYGGGHSNLEAVMATYDQPGSGPIAVFAARMLLEEAARMVWRYSLTNPLSSRQGLSSTSMSSAPARRKRSTP